MEEASSSVLAFNGITIRDFNISARFWDCTRISDCYQKYYYEGHQKTVGKNLLPNINGGGNRVSNSLSVKGASPPFSHVISGKRSLRSMGITRSNIEAREEDIEWLQGSVVA